MACELITAARASNLPLLVDGSGMNVVAARPQLVAGYQRCILTPNVAELGRMAKGVGIALEGKMTTAWQEHAQEVARRLQVTRWAVWFFEGIAVVTVWCRYMPVPCRSVACAVKPT